MITYFTYNQALKGCAGLRVSFYWKDGGKNLHDGKWTLEWKNQNVWAQKTGQIAKFPFPDDFLASQGLSQSTIPFCNQGGSTSFRFFLTDSVGLKSNIITGAVSTLEKMEIIPPPVATATDGITFVNPPNIADWLQYEKHPPGMKIPIEFKMNMAASVKTASVTISLTGEGQNISVIKKQKFINNNLLQTVDWKLPSSLKEGNYRFIAKTDSDPKKEWKSGKFTVARKGVNITFPARGAILHVGDIVPPALGELRFCQYGHIEYWAAVSWQRPCHKQKTNPCQRWKVGLENFTGNS